MEEYEPLIYRECFEATMHNPCMPPMDHDPLYSIVILKMYIWPYWCGSQFVALAFHAKHYSLGHNRYLSELQVGG